MTPAIWIVWRGLFVTRHLAGFILPIGAPWCSRKGTVDVDLFLGGPRWRDRERGAALVERLCRHSDGANLSLGDDPDQCLGFSDYRVLRDVDRGRRSHRGAGQRSRL